MNKLSSQEISSLIKLAAGLPSGSPERRALLAGLRVVSAYVPKKGDIVTPTISGKVGNSKFIYHKDSEYEIRDVKDDYGNLTVTLWDPKSGREEKISMFPPSIFKKVATSKLAGYDKSVWNAVPARLHGPILAHLGSEIVPGHSEPIPYFTGFERPGFFPDASPVKTAAGEFTLGHDNHEKVVCWSKRGEVVGFFLAPAP